MVIGIDASRANRKLKTGTEWYSFALIETLKQIVRSDSGDRVVLYSNAPLEGDLGKCPSGWETRVLGWWPRKLWTQFRLSWEMLRRPPDVLFIPAHAIPLIHPSRTVVTIHDIGFERLSHLYPWYDRLYHRVVVRFAIRRASQIIVPSEFTKQEIVDVYGMDAKNITVVHHGFNRQFSEVELPNGGSTSTSPYFLFIGRLEKKKNIVGLLHAYAEYRRQGGVNRLVLVGKPGFGYDEIAQMITELSLTNCTDVRGWVPQDEMPAFMRHATAFVFPTLYEGFGLPLLEAFAAGVPVIASAIPAVREIAGDAAYLVSPYHPEMLARALTLISTDSDLRLSLIARGRERVQVFAWKTAAEKTLTVLRHAVAE